MSKRSTNMSKSETHAYGEKQTKSAVSYGNAVASGIIILPEFARKSRAKIEETSPIFGLPCVRHVPVQARKRSREELIPDQSQIEWQRYQKARIERLARELDAAVRAYSEADSESVLKEDLASEEDERAKIRCVFIDDEAEEDNEPFDEKDEFIVLDDEDEIIVIE